VNDGLYSLALTF